MTSSPKARFNIPICGNGYVDNEFAMPIIESIVKGYYTSGSDNRSKKGGNPTALIETIMKKRDIMCVGVFPMMMTNFKALIDDKDLYTNYFSLYDKKLVAEFLISIANTYNDIYFFFIRPALLSDLKEFAKYGECHNEKYITNFRSNYFIDQERKKSSGGTQGGSVFKYNKINHDDQRDAMKEIILRNS